MPSTATLRTQAGPGPPDMPPGPTALGALAALGAATAATAATAASSDWEYDSLTGSLADALVDAGNATLARNGSLADSDADGPSEDYVFDRADVRALFIILYTLVFCCCFFGNLLVIIVVTLSRRLRSITNFFLANLAVADLCVGMFCVYQNLSIYLVQSWVLGDLVCKLYHFVHSLSYTASIFILVVICTERYFAIIHPITCKQILTPRRLRVVVVCVWVLSALYSSPRFFWVQTISMQLGRDGATETICISHRQKYNSEAFDIINFGLLYAAPLAVMLLLYTRIALVLWDAGRGPGGVMGHGFGHGHHRPRKEERSNSGPAAPAYGRGVAPTLRVTFDAARVEVNGANGTNGLAAPVDARVSISTEEVSASGVQANGDGVREGSPTTGVAPATPSASTAGGGQWSGNSHHHACHRKPGGRRARSGGSVGAHYHVSASQNILKARRGVVRMLIVVVLTFAICNLPYHARKMWQYWSPSYEGDSSFSTLFTPATFLLTYFNSGINPLLYAFLSRNFRKGMRELLLCPSRDKGRPLAAQSSITRKTSVRSATKLCAASAAYAPATGRASLALEHSGCG